MASIRFWSECRGLSLVITESYSNAASLSEGERKNIELVHN